MQQIVQFILKNKDFLMRPLSWREIPNVTFETVSGGELISYPTPIYQLD